MQSPTAVVIINVRAEQKTDTDERMGFSSFSEMSPLTVSPWSQHKIIHLGVQGHSDIQGDCHN